MEVGKPFLLDVAAVDSWYHTHLDASRCSRLRSKLRSSRAMREKTRAAKLALLNGGTPW